MLEEHGSSDKNGYDFGPKDVDVSTTTLLVVAPLVLKLKGLSRYFGL